MPIKVGIIFNYLQLPDVSNFPFVINKRKDGIFVRKGLFVCTNTIEGYLIGVVERIVLLNEYFTDALTIKAYNNENNPNVLKGLFPSEDFEFAIAIVRNLGLIKFKDETMTSIEKIQRMTYPASPGAEVHLIQESLLNEFLRLDAHDGLNLGKMKVCDFDAKIEMNRLLNKHFAILAISGAGKSYLTSVIIEELLMRKKEAGTPAIILIDVHGEYTYFKELQAFKECVRLIDISYFQIAIPKLHAKTYQKYQNKISSVQVRELSKYIKGLKKKSNQNHEFDLKDLMESIESNSEAGKSTKQALIGWLSELEGLKLFASKENPILKNVIKSQELTIFNLASETNIMKKQIIVDYICNQLFYLRRLNEIAPFLLIIEEAHQFCPDAGISNAVSKSIIETIAREGRKFMACLCLISQRPKRLSTTALSQLNSMMILNIKNPYDLKHLMDSSEAITKEYAGMISSLGVGEMLLMGNAINYPIFIDIRERKYKPKLEHANLSEACLTWQNQKLS